MPRSRSEHSDLRAPYWDRGKITLMEMDLARMTNHIFRNPKGGTDTVLERDVWKAWQAISLLKESFERWERENRADPPVPVQRPSNPG